MRILLSSNYAPPHGGVATTVYYLSKYLSLNKEEVTVVSFEDGFSNLPGCRVVKLAGWKVGNDFVPWKMFSLINLVKEQEVIFIQTPYFVISNILALLGKLFNKKVVCLNHGPISLGWRNRLHLPLINFLVDKWLFLNEENATFVRNYVNKIKPYQIVKNGIELDKYLNKQNSMKVNNRSLTTSYCLLSTDRPRFLFIGRLEKGNGMEELLVLIKAFPNFHFGFIGEGYYQKYLARFSNVQLYGSLNESEKITIMKQYNCLLFPSYQESFGLVILEALAVGLPVITTATNSNIPDLVRGNGIIVQVGDARGLVAAVREIAKQPIKIRTEYLNQYHWPNLIKTYLKAFNEV